MLVNCFVGKTKKKAKKIPNKIENDKNEVKKKNIQNDGKQYHRIELPPINSTKLIVPAIKEKKELKNAKLDSMKVAKIEENTNISERMKNALNLLLDIEFLSWIQENAIPEIKNGRNTLIKSPTGTGKTLSYAVPLIDKLGSLPTKICRQDGVFILIIVPTKELAQQTYTVFEKLLKQFLWIQASAIFGQDKRKSEKARFRKGLNIVISTPGRFMDHLVNTQSMDLTKLQTLVIDEADMLLDLGYENKMNEIFSEIEIRYKINLKNIQMILLSATLNEKVKKLSSVVLQDHVFIDATPLKKVAIAQELLSCNTQLHQTLVVLPIKWRFVGLLWFLYYALSKSSNHKIIIFVCSINSVNFHTEILRELFNYFPCLKEFNMSIFSLHGNMEIAERMTTFNTFDSSSNAILIATDVAARGLDFKNIAWVIQYNPARNPVDYVHRIGRTARAGSKGDAVVFLSSHEIEYVEVLKDSGMEIGKQYDLTELATSWIRYTNKSRMSNISEQVVMTEGANVHSTYKKIILASEKLNMLACKCFVSTVKSYTSYPKNLRRYFNPKNLHTGHLADSFGLEETPKNISTMVKTGERIISKKPLVKKKGSKTRTTSMGNFPVKRKILPTSSIVSEYSSNIYNGPVTKRMKRCK